MLDDVLLLILETLCACIHQETTDGSLKIVSLLFFEGLAAVVSIFLVEIPGEILRYSIVFQDVIFS